jgi:hypothetical protein
MRAGRGGEASYLWAGGWGLGVGGLFLFRWAGVLRTSRECLRLERGVRGAGRHARRKWR